MRIYEGMFLLDAARAAKDWDETKGLVLHVLERYGAEMLLHDKWDERKLAYQVKGQRRGAYLLAYFKATGDALVEIRRDLQLTDGVLRHLILAWPEDNEVPEKVEITRMLSDDELRMGRRGHGGGGDRDRDRDRRPPRPRPAAAAAPATAAPSTEGTAATAAPAAAEGGNA